MSTKHKLTVITEALEAVTLNTNEAILASYGESSIQHDWDIAAQLQRWKQMAQGVIDCPVWGYWSEKTVEELEYAQTIFKGGSWDNRPEPTLEGLTYNPF